jgi:release factor glutamine methyltransferase
MFPVQSSRKSMNRKLTMFALMTNKELYRDFLQQLRQVYNASEAAVITDLVFEKVVGLQRADIIKNPDQPVNTALSVDLSQCMHLLLQHKPVQYVLGEAWFYKMKLRVNEQVLIPRPETEELVQIILDDCREIAGRKNLSKISPEMAAGTILSMLDIGTGSGCIAIAVKKNMPDINMHALDISEGALSVAKENAIKEQVDITFLQVDFLAEDSWRALSVFDVIISNPPYIPLLEATKLDKNVTAYEPHAALFVPDDTPLIFYEKIAAFGIKHLAANGMIYVEIHENFALEAAQVFGAYRKVEIKKDIFGKDRMIVVSN